MPVRPETVPNRRRAMPWGEIPRGSFPGDGLVVVDKDSGVTSHDVVGAIRRLSGTKKVGHAGTLDPMATGVLCVGIGRVTKLLRYITGADKEYEATIRFGIETSTEDADGEQVRKRGAASLDRGELSRCMSALTGDVDQVPSSVSALKVAGRRAYDLVREGHDVALDARRVRVEAFEAVGDPRCGEIDGTAVVDLDVRVICGAGTYIRALARDLGQALGFGAHLTSLRRTRVGMWRLKEATTVRDLADAVEESGTIRIISLAELCHVMFPAVEVDAQEACDLRMGRFIPTRIPVPKKNADRVNVSGSVERDALTDGVAAGVDSATNADAATGDCIATEGCDPVDGGVAVAWEGETPVALVSLTSAGSKSTAPPSAHSKLPTSVPASASSIKFKPDLLLTVGPLPNRH